MWIEKRLTGNDLGLSSSHQSGIHISRSQMHALPSLSRDVKNPRYALQMVDSNGDSWPVSLIYYNNKFHGGTRNEIRLTGTIHCFRHLNCKVGDLIKLNFSKTGEVYIKYEVKIETELQTDTGRAKPNAVKPPKGESLSDKSWTTYTIRRGKD
jgi:hypothetical protein